MMLCCGFKLYQLIYEGADGIIAMADGMMAMATAMVMVMADG